MTEGLFRLSENSWRVSASNPVTYEVHTHRSLFNLEDPFLAETLLNTGGLEVVGRRSNRRLVVIDSVVYGIYGSEIHDYFATHGIYIVVETIDSNETTKHAATVETILEAMATFGIDRRREPVIVIGGGVLCDIVGFAASIYRRGTPYVRIPTTLIGLVDAGVGVKTGVNHGGGKNRIGTYAQPSVALLDSTFLRTVPERHLSNGMAEILKVALVKSSELFKVIEQANLIGVSEVFSNPEHADIADHLMNESIQLMLEELQPNLWESNLERCVDYGHTFGPTLEMHVLPELLHGEAVAIDMALTTGISFHRGLMSKDQAHRVLDAIKGIGIDPWSETLNDEQLMMTAVDDITKHRDGLQRIPLTRGLGGHLFVNDIGIDDVRAGARFIQSSVLSETN
ncbi:sedoheptulose 7-phosphate cyclase [Glutamicibacter sp. TV12E]|uniref:sedoheptulose 7-phosphate cyclase n=1 Tax=Glutamicibacter sp. TV12E TaxID=3446362 RepID=UPI00403489E3